MSDAFWAAADKAYDDMLALLRPRLQKPAVNAMFEFEGQYKRQLEQDAWDRSPVSFHSYLPSRITFFEDDADPSVYMDRDAASCVHHYIYRFGSIELRHMWDSVTPFFGEPHFWAKKTQCAAIERQASRTYRRVVFLFVVRSVHRTGGLGFWRRVSRFQDRYRCFEAGYDEFPMYCDAQTFAEEGKSVSIGNIHALETDPKKMDKTDPRHAYRQFNKVRFLINCEAAYKHLLDGPNGEPCVWATRTVWKSLARTEEAMSIAGLPDSVKDIPGNPFGRERHYKSMPIADDEVPIFIGLQESSEMACM